MRTSRLNIPLLAMVLAAPSLVGAATITISDDTFNPADWTDQVADDTGVSSSYTTSQELVDGNPAPCRKQSLIWGPGVFFVAHFKVGAGVDPSTTCGIATIGGHWDAYMINAPRQNAFAIALKQGGVIYMSSTSLVSLASWNLVTIAPSGAASFTRLSPSGPAHPDFSAAGAPIEIGYVNGAQTDATLITTATEVDNLVIDVVTPTFTLNVALNGSGLVTRTPDQAQYACGTSVDLSAEAALGSEFAGWSGDVTGGAPTASVVMSNNKSVLANFVPTDELCDHLLADAEWSSQIIVDTTPGQNGVQSAAQQIVEGNPQHYRKETHTWGQGLIRVAHVSSSMSITPGACGGIATIDYSYDLESFSPGTTRYGLLLVQSGNYFMHNADDISGHAPWTSFTHTGLTASSFLQVHPDGALGPEYPDFSSGTIQIGYHVSNSTDAASLTISTGLDNLCVTPYPQRPSLTVQVTGPGTVNASPDQLDYDCNTEVTLDAVPDAGMTFGGWGGDASGMDNPLSVVLDGSKTITALFGQLGVGAVPITAVELAPLMPTPSTGPVWVEFALPRTTHVSLAVLDVQGREVASLWNGPRGAGRYRLAWNAGASIGTARSSVYFVRLRTPENTLVRRIVSIR